MLATVLLAAVAAAGGFNYADVSEASA